VRRRLWRRHAAPFLSEVVDVRQDHALGEPFGLVGHVRPAERAEDAVDALAEELRPHRDQ
jgi:hypothetical protein